MSPRFQVRLGMIALLAALGCGYESALPFDASPRLDGETPPATGGTSGGTGGAVGTGGVSATGGSGGSGGQLADAAAPADASDPDAAPAVDASTEDGPATCGACYQAAVGTPACRNAKPNGCDDIPPEGLGMGPERNPGDRAICQALDDCMKKTGCWTDQGGAITCLCGTATNIQCATGTADGKCMAEILAATRTTSEIDANKRFFNTIFPSGFATQKYNCYKASCLALCK